MRKFFLIAALFLLPQLAFATSQNLCSVSGSANYMGCVNVKDYGAVGDGSTDDTAAIQAANDAAYAAHIQTTYFPPTGNCYKTTSSLYMDAPNNLRSDLANPPLFNFSISWVGEDGLGNHEGWGSRLCPNFNNAVAVYIGTGQGMHVRGLSIIGPQNAYRCAQDSSGVGYGLTGAGGGSSRVLIENLMVDNFYTSIKGSANGNGTLGDSNTLRKVNLDNACIGFYSAGTQNFINSLYDVSNRALNGVIADVGTNVHIYGGDYSATNARSAALAIASTSAITATASASGFDYTFTTTVTPDADFTAGVYNAFAVTTTNFGVIPLTRTAYNSGTHVATFKMLHAWSLFYFPAVNAQTDTTLQAEVQAATKVFSSEIATVFTGNNITVDGIHLENPTLPTTFFRVASGFGSSRNSAARNMYFNYDPAIPFYAPSFSPSDANLAKYYIAATFPFISFDAGSGDLAIESSDLGMDTTPLVVDWSVDGSALNRLVTKSTRSIYLNSRVVSGPGGFVPFNVSTVINTSALGGGEYDRTPFYAYNGGSRTRADSFRITGFQNSPFWGYRPAGFVRPCVTPGQLTDLGSLPPITYGGGAFTITYPLLWGGQQYQLCDWYVGTQASGYNIVSNHHFFTYGQNLTTTNVPNLAWSYKGQSFAVNCNLECVSIVFPGLGIKLNDGSSDVLYIVTGVFPGLGYFTVNAASGATDNSHLSGLKTSTITGTTIKQEAYSITQY